MASYSSVAGEPVCYLFIRPRSVAAAVTADSWMRVNQCHLWSPCNS